MTHKVSSDEHQNELSWEDAVTRFLEDHPEFLSHHPDLLAKLNLRHSVDGGATSLIERQVRVLREQNESLHRQLRELVAVARENDLLSGRLHRFALAMADSASLDDVFDNTYEMLRQEFKVDAVALLFSGEGNPAFARTEFVGSDSRLQTLLQEHSVGKPVCGANFDENLMNYVFGNDAARVRSAALIALGTNGPFGMLALGGYEANRFGPGMGTVYLAKLGDILMHSTARFLPASAASPAS